MSPDASLLVLVIEDDDAIRESVGEVLDCEGHVCWLEPDAGAALVRVQREEAVPRVILLDLMMPGLSPALFVEEVRQRPDYAGARIILMTASTESAIPKELDIDGVLLKPFSMDHLLEVVGAAAGHLPLPAADDRSRHVGA